MVLAETEDSPPSTSGRVWQEAADYAQSELPKVRRRIEEQIWLELGEA
jgi:hypothetical protein